MMSKPLRRGKQGENPGPHIERKKLSSSPPWKGESAPGSICETCGGIRQFDEPEYILRGGKTLEVTSTNNKGSSKLKLKQVKPQDRGGGGTEGSFFGTERNNAYVLGTIEKVRKKFTKKGARKEVAVKEGKKESEKHHSVRSEKKNTESNKKNGGRGKISLRRALQREGKFALDALVFGAKSCHEERNGRLDDNGLPFLMKKTG